MLLSPEMLISPIRRGLRADPPSGKQEVVGDLEQTCFSEVRGRKGRFQWALERVGGETGKQQV